MNVTSVTVPPPLRLSITDEDWRRRIEHTRAGTDPCHLCPRRCGALRFHGERGRCRVGAVSLLARAVVHHGEEPVLADERGVGNLFFAGCSLRCVYCQNHQISQRPRARRVCARARTVLEPLDEDTSLEVGWQADAEKLAQVFVDLAKTGVRAIGLVSATPHLATVLPALQIATHRGLKLPLIYNSSGYERVELLRILDGIVDIYLPDFKYASASIAGRLSAAPGYPEFALPALLEMHRQVGLLQLDDHGLAVRGVLVRHLVLPGRVRESLQVLRLLAERLGADLSLSLMAQYHPAYLAKRIPALDRVLRAQEYRRVLDEAESMDLHFGLMQQLSAAAHYLPDFDQDAHPFER